MYQVLPPAVQSSASSPGRRVVCPRERVYGRCARAPDVSLMPASARRRELISGSLQAGTPKGYVGSPAIQQQCHGVKPKASFLADIASRSADANPELDQGV